MTTVLDIITESLELIGVLAAGESVEAADSETSLRTLNFMVESWANDRLMVLGKARYEFALIALQQTYTIGPSGNINTTRPVRIEEAGVLIGSPAFEQPLSVLTPEQWAALPVKAEQSTYPTHLVYYQHSPVTQIGIQDSAATLGAILVWPVPTAISTVAIYPWTQITSFANVAVDVFLPPGYLRALALNLALEVAPKFGQAATARAALVANQAMEAKAAIKTANHVPRYLQCDPGVQDRPTVQNWYVVP